MSLLAGALVSLLIGLLLGLERERSQEQDERLFAGIRTFPLVVLAGFLGARAQDQAGSWVLPAVILAIGALAVAAYVVTSSAHSGATTEVVAIVAPLLGAFVAWEQALTAAALAVVITLLLTFKAPLHHIAGRVSQDEIVAILKFAVVAVVLLPLLPEEPVGPYGAIVPRHIGFVVLVVSAVSLAGYLLVRLLGGRAGWALAGLLGGLVSSTAVTLSLSGRARGEAAGAGPLAAGILLASTVLYARSALLAVLFDRELGAHVAPRLALPFATLAAFAFHEWRRSEGDERGADVGVKNPVELGRALMLAAVFAAILLAGRAAQDALGTAGLWLTGAAGGLVDVDSVTLASARLHREGVVSLQAAGGALLLASLANLIVKAAIVAVVGGAALVRRVAVGFAAVAAVSLLALLV
jgi:uncharacterized membrane protein (DUF4010 family)